MFGKLNVGVLAIIGGIAALAIVVLAFLTFATVGPGERGVLLDWGAPQSGVLSPGLHLVIPGMQHIVPLSIRVQKYSAPEHAASKDLQDVETTVALNWNILAPDAGWIYQHLGGEPAVEANIISPAVANAMKAVTAKYNAKDLIVHRDQVRAEVYNMVKRQLARYHIVVDAVNITNFSFSPQFSEAIERKQVAQQQAEQARYELQRAKVEAKQKVVTAQAEATAMKLKERSVTPGLVEWTAVQKWNGVLPHIMAGRGLSFMLPTAGAKS